MNSILVSACLLGVRCRYDGQTKPCDAVLRLAAKNNVRLIPVCPEQLGGLPTPRPPCERRGKTVVTESGQSKTAKYTQGAKETLWLARVFDCKAALLKERSPSCGCGEIYDGTFSKMLKKGDGVTAELLKQNGIAVFGESRLQEMCKAVLNE